MKLTNKHNLPAPIVLPRIHHGMSFEERFFASIQFEANTGCWLWERALVRDGYGKIDYNGKQTPAHRAAYMHFVGPILNGINVLHRCDTPPCVNPAHLFLGTQKENIKDMFTKGRQHDRCGEKQWQAKLTVEQVRFILASRGKIGCVKLAKQFNISHSVISNIWNGKRWSHIRCD